MCDQVDSNAMRTDVCIICEPGEKVKRDFGKAKAEGEMRYADYRTFFEKTNRKGQDKMETEGILDFLIVRKTKKTAEK